VIDDILQNLFVSLVHNTVPSNIENVESYFRREIRKDAIDSTIKRNCSRIMETESKCWSFGRR